MNTSLKLALIAAALIFPSVTFAQTELQMWHSMTDALGDKVGELATKFNSTQKDYKVVPVFKGHFCHPRPGRGDDAGATHDRDERRAR